MRNTLRNLATLALLAALFALAGCASLAGNASYRYDRVSTDGTRCTMTVDSGRTVAGPVELDLDDNCHVQFKAGDLTQGRSEVQNLLNVAAVLAPLIVKAPETSPAPPASIAEPTPQRWAGNRDVPVIVVPAEPDRPPAAGDQLEASNTSARTRPARRASPPPDGARTP